MANKYIENKENNQDVKKLDSKELLLQIMQQEYPNDPVFKEGRLDGQDLQQSVFTSTKPGTKSVRKINTNRNSNGILSVTGNFDQPKGYGKGKSNLYTNGNEFKLEDGTVYKGYYHIHPDKGPMVGAAHIDEPHEFLYPINTNRSKEYAAYKFEKSYPTVDEDELDEILDEEWEFYEDADDEEIEIVVEKGESGLFLANRDFALRDVHDLYITEGPEFIVQLEDNADEDVSDIFCIFYTNNGKAYPIPNYKTLEVMLVEAGLTYKSIRKATDEQFKQFDLRFDGNEETEQSPIDEFRIRMQNGLVRDRSSEWSFDVRFRSDYEIREPFKRDPGEYVKPEVLRGKNETEGTFGPKIDLYQTEDPEDIYFDTAFQGQTTKERFRELYEGKMIILDWPAGRYDPRAVDRGTQVAYDDAVLGLRLMINGHWKQVTNGFVMRLYAEYNPQFLDRQGKMALSTYQEGQGRYGTRGLINLLVQANAVTVLNAAGDTSISSDDGRGDPLWTLFSHIVDADGDRSFADDDLAAEAGVRPDGRRGLDPIEYLEYLDNYTNGGQPFNNPILNKYEPAGSVAYYDQDQYKSLIAEAILQERIDTIKDDILEIFPRVAAGVQETRALFNTFPNNYNQYVTDRVGANSPMYGIWTSSKQWKYVKKKRKKLKRRRAANNLFELYNKSYRLRVNLNRREENKIVQNSGKHWMKTIKKDKFNPQGLKIATQLALGFHPIGIIAGFGVRQFLNLADRLVGEVPHASTSVLPPFRFMADDNYLNSCIYLRWQDRLEELYDRSVEIDENWTEIVAYVDKAEGLVDDFDTKFLRASSISEFQDLLETVKEIDEAINSDEVLDLIERANILKRDVDSTLKTALKNSYKAIQYMRKEVQTIGRRKKFSIIWPSSAQEIMNDYVYGETLKFDNYIKK